ncbi:nuclear transport factor 2 family protein, partial [Ruegeria sp. NA]
KIAKDFLDRVLIAKNFDLIDDFVAKDLIQHDPNTADGSEASRTSLEAMSNGIPPTVYDRCHRVLAEGNFSLCMSESRADGV